MKKKIKSTYKLIKKKRIERRDKKSFHRDQYKEIEENNRIGTTRNIFKKIRDFLPREHFTERWAIEPVYEPNRSRRC